MSQDFASISNPEPIQNTGYAYLLGIYWMKDAQAAIASDKNRYFLPAKALMSACMAIDGYVNVVGSMVDPRWKTIDEDNTPFQEKLTRIYQSLSLPLTMNENIWGNVLLLFQLREKLNRFDLGKIYGAQEKAVPNIFKVVARNYPIRRTHGIAEEAIERLLSISE